jgi:NADH pyrophosphatase NudC (nudix superfamily)
MDFNENAEESVVREIKEELGIEIKNFKYFGSQHDIYAYGNITFPTLGLIFTGEIQDVKIEALDDVSEVKFFKPEDLPFETIAFEAIKRALKDYVKTRR